MSTQPLEGDSWPAHDGSVSLMGQQIVVDAWKLQDNGQPEAAWDLIQPLLDASIPNPYLGLVFARLSRQFNQESRALAYLEWLLSLAAMPPDRSAALHLAAFAILDRKGEYDAAFEHARLGKQVYRTPFDRRRSADSADALINYFTADKVDHLPRPTHGSRRPVFIVGMPRSGTSLVEQILACHPQVHAAGELSALYNVRVAIPEKSSPEDRYPACLDSMGIRQADQLSSIYLRTIDALNSTSRYVTDKMPTNYVFLGLVAVLFRDCHVIHCQRHPLDTCLSCYTTHFEPGLPFSHDLTDLGAFYRDYRRLMIHWRSAIGLPTIEVCYENLVEDLEGETRRLLQLLDLPWDERCLEFHRNLRRVGTASADQVRQPIYKSSVGRWKRYEKHLAELISALGADSVAT